MWRHERTVTARRTRRWQYSAATQTRSTLGCLRLAGRRCAQRCEGPDGMMLPGRLALPFAHDGQSSVEACTGKLAVGRITLARVVLGAHPR